MGSISRRAMDKKKVKSWERRLKVGKEG